MFDDADITDELAYMAEHPAKFTKADMAAMMKSAVETIRADRAALASIREEIRTAADSLSEFEDQLKGAVIIKAAKPQGNA